MCSFGTDEYICRIVAQHSKMLLRLAYTRLGSTADAEDAVQEVFLLLLKKNPQFRDAEHEKAWLIRATLHRASDVRRKADRGHVPLDEIGEISQQAPQVDSLLSTVYQLPQKYSAVIHLYYYEGYSLKEIAKILGMPVPTIGARLSRGRQKLKQLLEEETL